MLEITLMQVDFEKSFFFLCNVFLKLTNKLGLSVENRNVQKRLLSRFSALTSCCGLLN